jgi:D-sedoheptulose 7-phosphate isomerase
MAPSASSNEILRHLHCSAEIVRRTAAECAADIALAADAIARAITEGGKILLCGNGGSAADCQHMAAEFVSRLTSDFLRPGIPAIALTTDTSFLTAYGNDVDFDGVFARQVDTLGRAGDVLIGISTSGRSKNVLRAIEHAKRGGSHQRCTDGSGGPAADLAHISVRIPSEDTACPGESLGC